MSNIKTFEGFLDFLKPKPKPDLAVEPLSEEQLSDKVTAFLSPLSRDSEFLMSVQKHELFHLDGLLGDVKYNIGIFKTSFYASKEDSYKMKSILTNNVRTFEYFVADENPSEEHVLAEQIVKVRVEKMLSRVLKDSQIQLELHSSGRIVTSGIVDLGFKFTLVLKKENELGL